jgi:DNA-binding SARP family transcriptional activator
MLRDGGPEIDYILFANDAYLVNPALSFWCDVDVFESAIVAGRAAEAGGRRTEALGAYAQAEALYEGAFLADAVYEQWSTSERERLRLRYLEVANRLANLHLDAGDIESAADVSRHVLQQEACDEDSHRRLIRCYGALGRRNLVIQQYRTYVKSNEDAYGLGPSAETTAVFQSVITNQTV